MFELNGVKYDFKRINVEDALRVQHIFKLISQDDDLSGKNTLSSEEIAKLEKELGDIALKYLRVYVKVGNKEQTIEEQDSDYYAEQIFDNPFFIIEIVASFGEVIKGFLELLPRFKKKLEEAKKSQKNQDTNK